MTKSQRGYAINDRLPIGHFRHGFYFIWIIYQNSSIFRKIDFLIGDYGYRYNKEAGDIFDFYIKHFLVINSERLYC